MTLSGEWIKIVAGWNSKRLMEMGPWGRRFRGAEEMRKSAGCEDVPPFWKTELVEMRNGEAKGANGLVG
jgi:hypothetical protein